MSVDWWLMAADIDADADDGADAVQSRRWADEKMSWWADELILKNLFLPKSVTLKETGNYCVVVS